jgi:ribosomal protein S12 methylthiotransferase
MTEFFMFNILMVSLGCDKNLCDSEEMLGILASRGYNITNDEREADAVIVNTCSFIKDAMTESINTVLEMARLKEGRLKYLLVAGCLAERFKNEIAEELPEVDGFIGTTGFEKIADLIDELRQGETKVTAYEPVDYLTETSTQRIVTSSPYMAYLKIAEGCDKHCTYCAIPSFRGRYRSVPKEKLLAQVVKMAESGVKELVLVAQETTCYGVDLYGAKKLHELIHALSEIEGIEWIRLLYCYPEEIYDELIDEMATNKKVCHYIDMPLQHSEDVILGRMGRRIKKAEIIEIVQKLRNRMPDIAIRTTLIAGFPGETDEMHEDLMRFINEMEFDRLGVFTFSPEEGTPAAEFPDQVPEERAERYRDEIMELQQEISYDINQKLIGSEMDVIIEGYITDDDVYAARSYRDAPNVDGLVFVRCDYELISGSIVKVKITDASDYDIGGVLE